MPVADGFELIARVRRTGRTPIVVLSVRGGDADKIRALDLGADDYVVKPFSVPELLARVRAQLRRHADESAAEILEFPGLTLDRERRRVVVEGKEVRLTPTELAILELLASHAGKPVTIRQIIGRVWHGRARHDARRRPRPRRLAPQEDRARSRAAPLHRHGAVGGLPVRGGTNLDRRPSRPRQPLEPL